MTDVTIYSAPLPEGPEASHRLLRRAAALAAPQLTDCTLARQAQGKPWFPAAPELHFSISHSGGRWVCAFTDAPVGLDLQAHRPCRALALARRFFAPEEAEWLRSRGEAAFFDLWCAKESWLKYTGRGLSALPEAIVLAPDGQFPARLRRVFAVRVYEGCRAGRVARTVRQHRTIASSRFGGSFPSILRFETFEIHTVFLHVSNLGLTKNLSPNLLAELRGAAIKAFLAEGFSSA